jgi:multidrug efflux pump subunit AcrA (membrane-fusion protein)
MTARSNTTASNNGHADGVTGQLTSAALAAPLAAPEVSPSRATALEQTRSAASVDVAEVKPWKTRWVVAFGVVFAIALLGAFAAATSPRIHHQRQLAAAADKEIHAPPRRAVVTVQRSAADSERELPGSAQAYATAAIYGRTNGYLKRWLVDIGDRVQAGQLIAEIATPEIDAQLEQAKATLLQSKANLLKLQADEVYARSQETRYRSLIPSGATT